MAKHDDTSSATTAVVSLVLVLCIHVAVGAIPKPSSDNGSFVGSSGDANTSTITVKQPAATPYGSSSVDGGDVVYNNNNVNNIFGRRTLQTCTYGCMHTCMCECCSPDPSKICDCVIGEKKKKKN